ncbi:hypothetical protein ACFFX0_02250 [Citricoccus parietis]|uniref:Uncharacterized protein n=1 Tax=Citricoccus parietis TaxID=592307 RepID=A0ABV5FTT6_9MICC
MACPEGHTRRPGRHAGTASPADPDDPGRGAPGPRTLNPPAVHHGEAEAGIRPGSGPSKRMNSQSN